ncbi:MAG: sulfotransferase [Actinomycetota bacterium]|nr:sulfotransferase [Actinomycetota bacterium]
MSAPIVVTGSHRSGTTWVGRMLCASGEAGYIHEPLNPVRRPNWNKRPVPYWYVYICDENQERYAPSFDDLLRFRYPIVANLKDPRSLARLGTFATEALGSIRLRRRQPRPLLKDPFALFSTEWLARTLGAKIVVTIRHPAAFVGSIKRLDWQFKFKKVLSQDLLMRDWLHPFEEEMRRCRDQDVDIVEQGIVLWKVLHHVVDELRRRHPDWVFVRHEDLAADPVGGFERLYAACELTWDERAAAEVRTYSSASGRKELPTWRHGSVKRDSAAAAETWRRRLSPDEIARVKKGVGEVATRFYPDAEWEPAPQP